jgi:hypothetical protein
MNQQIKIIKDANGFRVGDVIVKNWEIETAEEALFWIATATDKELNMDAMQAVARMYILHNSKNETIKTRTKNKLNYQETRANLPASTTPALPPARTLLPIVTAPVMVQPSPNEPEVVERQIVAPAGGPDRWQELGATSDEPPPIVMPQSNPQDWYGCC